MMTTMKIKNIFFGIGLSCLLVLVSCESVLEVEPEFQKEGSQIFKTLDDYDYALTGAYALFRAVGYYGSGGQTTSTWANLPEMMGTDLVRTAEDLANWQTQANWTYTADETDLDVAWIAAYSVIAQANLVLRNIEQFSAESPQAVNRIKGQALAIRGLAHFDLFRYWAESYDRTSTGRGIPYIETVDINAKPGRLTVAQSYDKIFADLELAEDLLADVDKPVNATGRYYLDVTGVQAILARVNLYAKDYVAAETYASEVITAIPLASRAAFPGIWTDASTADVIWSVAFNLGEGQPSVGVHISSSNRNRFKPSAALEATYDAANDVRYSSYFATRTLSGTPRRIVSKFYGRNAAPPTASDNLVNWKAFRTGEMYLIRAEARAMQAGKEVLALADLNALRLARINGYVAEVLTGQPLVDAIMLERRKELFGEGHQWFDIKRTTRTITRVATDNYIGGTPLTLAPTAREWEWPIPTPEINANENIRAQQNPGF
jgi:starch-binding outer membrane protein, SusD/RagB family